MEAPFKSKLLTAYDYHNIDPAPYCVPFVVDEEVLAESLLSVRKKYAKFVSVQTIERGDFAVLSCKSEKPKFQKDSVNVCVGKNLYSKELEEKLIGLSAGASDVVVAEGEAVSVHIKEIRRSVLPELTDEFTASHFTTVKTVAELKKWYIGEQREAHIKAQAVQAAETMIDEIVSQSDIRLDEEERLAARKNGEEILREHWRFNGIDLDDMTDEEAAENFGVPSVSAYIEWFADLSERDLSTALIGYDLLIKSGREFTREQYEAELEKNSEEANIPAEELGKQFTFQAYVRQTGSEYFSSMLEDYIYNYIKEELQ